MEIFLGCAAGAVAILTFGAGFVAGYKSKKKAPCDTCDHLTKKGGGWKYYCNGWGWDDGFDRPPEYCKSYKPREESE